MLEIAETHEMNLDTFTKNYLIDYEEKDGVCIFQTSYDHTSHATAPKDGKLRGIRPDPSWLTVSGQHIVPNPGNWELAPLSVNIIYS